MKDILRLVGSDYMTVAVEDFPSSTMLEYIQYHKYPTVDLDSMFHFANWSSQRGFKTYIYVNDEQPFFWKLLFKFTFWLGLKCGKFHNKLVRGCP